MLRWVDSASRLHVALVREVNRAFDRPCAVEMAVVAIGMIGSAFALRQAAGLGAQIVCWAVFVALGTWGCVRTVLAFPLVRNLWSNWRLRVLAVPTSVVLAWAASALAADHVTEVFGLLPGDVHFAWAAATFWAFALFIAFASSYIGAAVEVMVVLIAAGIRVPQSRSGVRLRITQTAWMGLLLAIMVVAANIVMLQRSLRGSWNSDVIHAIGYETDFYAALICKPPATGHRYLYFGDSRERAIQVMSPYSQFKSFGARTTGDVLPTSLAAGSQMVLCKQEYRLPEAPLPTVPKTQPRSS